MAFKYKELVKYSLLFFMILSVQKSLCSIEEEQVEIFQNNDNKTQNTLGDFCWNDNECSEGQICNEIFKCECGPGFKNRSNICVECAGENEECLTSHDCCGMLFCINGICRKASPNGEFITLAKICLGITVTSIIIALLSSLLKCLLRFDNSFRFGQCWTSQDTNSTNTQGRHVLESQPPPSRIQEEKPPSYEECMRQSQRNSRGDPPPPYVISSNDFIANKRDHVFPVRSITEITPPNNITTSLNIQERFPNESFSQKTITVQSP